MSNFYKLGEDIKTNDQSNVRRLVVNPNGGNGGFGLTFFYNNPTTMAFEKYVVPASTNLIPHYAEVTYNGSLLIDCEIGFHTDAVHAGADPASGITNWIGDISTNLSATANKDAFQFNTSAPAGVLDDYVNLSDQPIAPSSVASGKYVWIAFYIGVISDHCEIALVVEEQAV